MARKAKGVDGVYQRNDRPGYWITWNDAQGRRRRRLTNAQTLAQARRIVEAERLKVEHARVLGYNPPGDDTFADVAKRYLAHQKARLSARAYRREAAAFEVHLKPAFACKLAAIRRADVQRYVTTRAVQVARPKAKAQAGKERARTSPYTLQRELNMLKHLFRLAVEWEIVPLNPAQGVKSPRVPAGRVRYLQPAELQELIRACPVWLRPVVAIAVSTGMRRGEILGLRWLDVDMAGGRVLLPQTKNGEGRIVYLNAMASAAFASLPRPVDAKPSDLIFPQRTPERVSVAFARAVRAAGIEDFRFHDLRHTAASWLRMQGADIQTVAHLLGHKDLRMTARYAHLSPDFLAAAVRKLDGVFGGTLALPAASPGSAQSAISASCVTTASPAGTDAVAGAA